MSDLATKIPRICETWASEIFSHWQIPARSSYKVSMISISYKSTFLVITVNIERDYYCTSAVRVNWYVDKIHVTNKECVQLKGNYFNDIARQRAWDKQL